LGKRSVEIKNFLTSGNVYDTNVNVFEVSIEYEESIHIEGYR
jgi:hypothetical protein